MDSSDMPLNSLVNSESGSRREGGAHNKPICKLSKGLYKGGTLNGVRRRFAPRSGKFYYNLN